MAAKKKKVIPKPKIPAWQKTCRYKKLLNLDSFEGYPIEEFPNVAVDTETTGLNKFAHKLVGISFSFRPEEAFYIPVGHKHDENVPIEKVTAFLNTHIKPRLNIMFNAKFDSGILEKHANYVPDRLKDPGIMLYNTDIGHYKFHSKLKMQAKKYLGIQMLTLEEVLGVSKKFFKDKNFSDIMVDDVTLAYACADADITFRLFNHYRDELKALRPELARVHELDHRLIPVLSYMDDSGIKIDVDYLDRMKKRLIKELAELEEEINKDVVAKMGEKIAVTSGPQLAKFLYEGLKLPVIEHTPTGRPATDKETIQKLIDANGNLPIFKLLREFKNRHHTLTTYVEPMLNGIDPRDGRLHPNYNQVVQVTGRLSSGGDGNYLPAFNIMNLPKMDPKKDWDNPYNIRNACIPRAGCTFAAIDLANIELRIIANYSKDPNMIEIFQSGGDLHDATAWLVFKKKRGDPDFAKFRKIAKTMNFNLAYAFNIYALKNKLEIEAGLFLSDAELWNYFNLFFNKAYPLWGIYKRNLLKKCQEQMYTTTLFNRYRDLSSDYKMAYEIKKKTGKKGALAHVDNQAINHPIQGSQADLIRFYLIKIFNTLKKEGLLGNINILTVVHDEICFEVPGKPGELEFDNHIMKLKGLMEWTPAEWLVKVVSDPNVGFAWGSLKPWIAGKTFEELKWKD